MSNDLPTVALSIRQPWAWLIVNGHKDIENRRWSTRFRGRVLIHAAKTFSDIEKLDCRWVKRMRGIEIPQKFDLGGIVGEVEISDCVSNHASRWFVGPYGFVLRNARPLPFVPCKGALSFFRVNI